MIRAQMCEPTTEPGLLSSAAVFPALKAHAEEIKAQHLRDLMADEARCASLLAEHNGITMDISRQKVTPDTMALLTTLFEQQDIANKLAAVQAGEVMNPTEGRSVLHTALRSSPDQTIMAGGKNVVPDVHEVLGRMKAFSERVRSGEWKGATGKSINSFVVIGIGGSYLGPEFVCEALRFDKECAAKAEGFTTRFLANVDPVDVTKALEGLDPETTLAVVCSKTFTTAETILNAKTVRQWVTSALGDDAVGKHMAAISTNLAGTKEFGIEDDSVFGFWDWVGGRYSVTSAIGVLPIALQFGYEAAEQFLAGARDIDQQGKCHIASPTGGWPA
jgi:glucose-6-phosphate isomerase